MRRRLQRGVRPRHERDADRDARGRDPRSRAGPGCHTVAADQCTVGLGASRSVAATFAQSSGGGPDTAPPSTAITKGPKDKTKKKTATFEFTATDARAVAGFECSLDGAAFSACSSPLTVKVKRGKHTFRVRAIDDAGNVGQPASDDWKRKRRKRK